MSAFCVAKLVGLFALMGWSGCAPALPAREAGKGRQSNLTGINFLSVELVAKRLELLRELVPTATRVAVLVNPITANTESTVKDVELAARSMGLQIYVLNASTSREIDAAFATLVRERPDALFVGPDPFFLSRRVQLVNLASRHVIPVTYSTRDFPEAGGLMSYGSNLTDVYRQVGIYTGRILKGTKPADCRSCSPRSSSSSSTTRPPGCSASRCPTSCSWPPTR